MALGALHDAGVLHGDVSLRNIVFNSTDNSVKFIDFGNFSTTDCDVSQCQVDMAQPSDELDRLDDLSTYSTDDDSPSKNSKIVSAVTN